MKNINTEQLNQTIENVFKVYCGEKINRADFIAKVVHLWQDYFNISNVKIVFENIPCNKAWSNFFTKDNKDIHLSKNFLTDKSNYVDLYKVVYIIAHEMAHLYDAENQKTFKFDEFHRKDMQMPNFVVFHDLVKLIVENLPEENKAKKAKILMSQAKFFYLMDPSEFFARDCGENTAIMALSEVLKNPQFNILQDDKFNQFKETLLTNLKAEHDKNLLLKNIYNEKYLKKDNKKCLLQVEFSKLADSFMTKKYSKLNPLSSAMALKDYLNYKDVMMHILHHPDFYREDLQNFLWDQAVKFGDVGMIINLSSLPQVPFSENFFIELMKKCARSNFNYNEMLPYITCFDQEYIKDLYSYCESYNQNVKVKTILKK